VQETGTHDNPTIRLLERHIQSIASQVPQSFARMRAARVHMRAIFVSDGMPGYWLTINPADLNSPIVVILAGVALSCDELRTDTTGHDSDEPCGRRSILPSYLHRYVRRLARGREGQVRYFR
jgi:hypothetical protein